MSRRRRGAVAVSGHQEAKEAGQGYTSVGWLSTGFVATFADAANRNDPGPEQRHEGVRRRAAKTKAQAGPAFRRKRRHH